MAEEFVYSVGAGAGFAGDRTDQAVKLARSGQVNVLGLECLAERTIVPAIRARKANPEAGADPRLRRRLAPLLPPAKQTGCRIVSNLGAANPAAAGRAVAALARELGCTGIRIAAVEGDDVTSLRDEIAWHEPLDGELIGAHAYIGADALLEPIVSGADVVVCGRAADSALFAAPLLPHLDGSSDALAAALTVGHLLECSGQVTGGNFEASWETPLSAEDLANLGYPIAHVRRDGSADITMLDDAPGRVDRLTCTVQLLYEVHDPTAYITPDAIVDFTTVRFEQVGCNRVRMTGPKHRGVPPTLKVSGFVARRGIIADLEIGFAGTGALDRTRLAADCLRLRLSDWPENDIRIDIVGVDSILGGASVPTNALPAETRLHVSAVCADEAQALIVEDEVYALTISGPAGGGSVRNERRPRIDTLTGFIPRERVKPTVHWSVA
ncbi:MAG: acyclic terpene utilization AtuA family protein [Acetobacteraceae bacterium]